MIKSTYLTLKGHRNQSTKKVPIMKDNKLLVLTWSYAVFSKQWSCMENVGSKEKEAKPNNRLTMD
jgi:hypothetical protein